MTTRRKSYTAEYKLKAVKFAETLDENGKENGNRAAAAFYKVDESMVRKWRTMKEVLKATKRNRRSFRSSKPQWPELERELKEWVIQQRAEKNQVSIASIGLHAKEIAQTMGIADFKGGASWCHNFMRRANLKLRARGAVKRKRPTSKKTKTADAGDNVFYISTSPPQDLLLQLFKA